MSRFRIDRFSETVFNQHFRKEGYFCQTLHVNRIQKRAIDKMLDKMSI